MIHLPDKIVSDSQETIDKIKEVAPFIVIGVIWLFGAIAKTIQAGKKNAQTGPQKKPSVRRKPENLADFIKIVKEQYAAARAQVTKAEKDFNKPPVIEFTTPAQIPTMEKPIATEKPPVEEPQPALGYRSFVPEEFGMPGDVLTGELASSGMSYASNPYLKDISSQFANAENLRRAFIYSEILRPPLALRE